MTVYDTQGSDGRGDLVRGAGALFPVPVVHVELFHDVHEDLFPEESHVIASAVGKRRREFITARSCAREALRRLGHPAVPVPRGPSGAPVWPTGVVGSITHCPGYRSAAVAESTRMASLGLDAEPNLPLPDGAILSLISSPSERHRLSELSAHRPEVCWERLLFSAKESVYKAWNPLVGRHLGFADAEVAFCDDGTFGTRITAFGAGTAGCFDGAWQLRDGILRTAVAVTCGGDGACQGHEPPTSSP
jgi:4'-phosphopantetheinyl transferase EntD